MIRLLLLQIKEFNSFDLTTF